jgi:hypothetical protein
VPSFHLHGLLDQESISINSIFIDYEVLVQVSSILASKDSDAAAFSISKLRQKDLLNDNLHRQGLPAGSVLSLSSQVCRSQIRAW